MRFSGAFTMTSRSLLAALSLIAAAGIAAAQDAPAPPPGIADQVALCATCHGEDGRPVLENAPIIWGQEYFYTLTQLRDYHAGRRTSEIMQPIVAELNRDQMKALAEYFSKLPWPNLPYSASPEAVSIAQQMATSGQCSQCHLGSYLGNSSVPRMAGQKLVYLEETMLAFKNAERKNSPEMVALMRGFPDEQIAAMAEFLAGL
jgi:cytochrome c553